MSKDLTKKLLRNSTGRASVARLGGGASMLASSMADAVVAIQGRYAADLPVQTVSGFLGTGEELRKSQRNQFILLSLHSPEGF